MHILRTDVLEFSAIPASALDEDDDDEDDGSNDVCDDERSGTRYNVCHSIIAYC
jgi:hypothetical protein